jgi:hypothetical protein
MRIKKSNLRGIAPRRFDPRGFFRNYREMISGVVCLSFLVGESEGSTLAKEEKLSDMVVSCAKVWTEVV